MPHSIVYLSCRAKTILQGTKILLIVEPSLALLCLCIKIFASFLLSKLYFCLVPAGVDRNLSCDSIFVGCVSNQGFYAEGVIIPMWEGWHALLCMVGPDNHQICWSVGNGKCLWEVHCTDLIEMDSLENGAA